MTETNKQQIIDRLDNNDLSQFKYNVSLRYLYIIKSKASSLLREKNPQFSEYIQDIHFSMYLPTKESYYVLDSDSNFYKQDSVYRYSKEHLLSDTDLNRILDQIVYATEGSFDDLDQLIFESTEELENNFDQIVSKI